MSRLISSKRTLYDSHGKELCYGSSAFGGKLTTKGNKKRCELLELAFRPTNNVTEKYNRRETRLHEYYKNLLKQEIPQSLEKYKDKFANLRLTDGIGFIHVYGKSDIIILLPRELFININQIINESNRIYKQRVTTARKKRKNFTRPLSVGTRIGASVLPP